MTGAVGISMLVSTSGRVGAEGTISVGAGGMVMTTIGGSGGRSRSLVSRASSSVPMSTVSALSISSGVLFEKLPGPFRSMGASGANIGVVGSLGALTDSIFMSVIR